MVTRSAENNRGAEKSSRKTESTTVVKVMSKVDDEKEEWMERDLTIGTGGSPKKPRQYMMVIEDVVNDKRNTNTTRDERNIRENKERRKKVYLKEETLLEGRNPT